MKDIIISDDIIYIGADDKDIELFENQYNVPNGVAYNSYIIIDKKIAIMDTIDKRRTNQWLENLDKALNGRKPDYLVISHLEPDHAYNINTLIKKYADKFLLTSSLGDIISSYSHGMKQKLVIISALIHKPSLIILDEPFVGLDPKSTKDVKDIMKELCKENVTFFFSSHVLEVVEKLCDEVAIIKDGKILEVGSVDKIKGNKDLTDAFLEKTYEK